MHTFTVQHLPTWYDTEVTMHPLASFPYGALASFPDCVGGEKCWSPPTWSGNKADRAWEWCYVSMPLCMATGGMWPLRKTLQYPHVYNNTIIAVFQGYHDDVDTTITMDKSNFKWNGQIERLLLGSTCKSEVRQKLCLKYSGNCTHNRATGGISLICLALRLWLLQSTHIHIVCYGSLQLAHTN